MTSVRFPRTVRARAVAAVAGLAVAGGAVVAAIPRSPPVPAPLTEGLAQDPCHPQDVMAVPPGASGRYQGDSGVLRSGGLVYLAPGRFGPVTAAVAACARASVRASQRWLAAGTIPGTGAQQRAMATRALLDLRLSVRPDGAVVAGWHQGWRYSWPRDSSWVAAALADTDHDADSLQILRFLQRTQLPDGRWAARYWPDGSGPVHDGRPVELDADGWVPWAVWSWATAAGAMPPAQRCPVPEPAGSQLPPRCAMSSPSCGPWSARPPAPRHARWHRAGCPPRPWTTGRTRSRSRWARPPPC